MPTSAGSDALTTPDRGTTGPTTFIRGARIRTFLIVAAVALVAGGALAAVMGAYWGKAWNGIAFAVVLFAHGALTLGWKPAAKWFGSGVIVAYVLEEIGVHTGWIFGPYVFNEPMGPKIDVIPIATGIGWAGFLNMGWVLTNLILDHSPIQTNHGHGRIWSGAALGGLIVTAIDLSLDPVNVAAGNWTWLEGGSFFGVPYHNYFGWWLVTFVSFLVHGYLVRGDGIVDIDRAEPARRWLTLAMPVMYAVFGLIYGSENFGGALGLVTAISMGIPLYIAVSNWIGWYRATRHLATRAARSGAAQGSVAGHAAAEVAAPPAQEVRPTSA